MDREVKIAIIRCEDYEEALVFDRSIWGDGEEWYEFSIKDDYIGGSEYQGFFGRLRRAWRAFRDKPVCYTSVLVDDKRRVKQFLNDCIALVDEQVKEVGS